MTDKPTLPEPTERDKQHWKEAERAHDLQNDQFKSHSIYGTSFAIETIRTITLTCLGGIAAVLGFLSANYARLAATPGAVQAVNTILVLIFISLIICMLCSTLAYFSQLAYSEVSKARVRQYPHPYVIETDASKAWAARGDALRWLAVLAGLISVGFLVCAGATFAQVVR